MCASVVLAADVNMTLKNTEPLVDTDGATKLVGSSTTTGDLVQLIDLGVNGQIDLPNADGTPGGDDSLVSAGTCRAAKRPPATRSTSPPSTCVVASATG